MKPTGKRKVLKNAIRPKNEKGKATKHKFKDLSEERLNDTTKDEKPGFGAWVRATGGSMRPKHSVKEFINNETLKQHGLKDYIKVTQHERKPGCFGKQKIVKKTKYIKHTNDFTGIIISNKKEVKGSWYFPIHFLEKVDSNIESSKLENLGIPEKIRNRPLFLFLEFSATSNIPRIYLQFETEKDKENVERCFNNLISTLADLTPADHQMLRLWRIFNEVDDDRKGKLVNNEIIEFFKRVEIDYTDDFKKTVQDTLKKIKYKDGQYMNAADGLDWSEVKVLYGQLLIPMSLRKLMEANDTSGDNEISLSELKDFLKSQQMEYVYLDVHGKMETFCSSVDSDVLELMNLFDRDGNKNWTQEEFSAFIHKCCNAVDPKAYTHYQDMTRPMTEYFIASSHNTYLEGDQINGPCSLQAYIRSIQRGCRCVEIDCWDDDDEPCVYHGYCPCKRTRLSFRDVVTECAKYAFEKDKPYSKFPFILSLENHCKESNQEKMAKYIKEAFGERLITELLDREEKEMPSPAALGPRCIVKGKKLKESAFLDDSDSNINESGYVDEEDESAETEHGEKDQSETVQTDGRSSKKKLKLHKCLSDITIYTVSRHLKPFDAEPADDDYKYISSIKEGKGEQIMKEEGAKLIKHTNRELARIYPNGSRFQSDNYDPLPFWAHGCQVVALNYQTDGPERLKNQIMFQINNNCGYVLKPQLLRNPCSNFDPNDKKCVKKETKFTIKIISGQQFHNKIKHDETKAGDVCDPYVKLEIVSGSDLEKAQKFKSSVVKNNGFNPSWEKDTAANFAVKFPDFAMLEVKVHDHGSEEILGMSYIPIAHIQPGYRFIELYDMTGQNITNTRGTLLFAQITLNGIHKSKGKIIPKPTSFPAEKAVVSNDKSILDLKESDLLQKTSKSDSSKRKLQDTKKCIICTDRKCIINNPVHK